MRTWFSADYHWGDSRLDLLGRPFLDRHEARDTILNNLCVVGPEDTLYVIGDVAIDENWLSNIKSIKCAKKILVKGNYDRLPDEVYKRYFDEVCEQIGLLSVMDPMRETKEPLDLHLVHYPSKGIERAFNICGHVHGAWKVQKNMLNVGVDNFHFRPVPLEKVFFYYRAISHFYDQDVWVANHPANTAHALRGKVGTYWQTGFKGSRDAK